MDDKRLLEVIDRVYGAAVDSSAWPRALQEITATTASTSAALALRVGGPGRTPMVWCSAAATPQDVDGTTVSFAERGLLVKDGRQGVVHEGPGPTPLLGLPLVRDVDCDAFLALAGAAGESGAAPAPSNGNVLSRLLPHLQNAVRMQQRLMDVESRSDLMMEVVDRLSFGVVLLEADRGIVFVNSVARCIADENDALHLAPRGPTANSAADTAELRRLVNRAAATARGEQSGGGGHLSLPRSSGGQDLKVFVAPILPRSPPTAAPTIVALFIADPERGIVTPLQFLRDAFGMTTAEARLAMRIAQGKTLEESSEELGIRINTARSQLKAVFAKTGVDRQAGLVRLLLTVAAPFEGRQRSPGV